MTRAVTRVRDNGPEATPEPSKATRRRQRHEIRRTSNRREMQNLERRGSALQTTDTATPEPPKTTRKRRTLIGNEMHSPAKATALKPATYIFLIGNEFHFHRAPFQGIFTDATGESGRDSPRQSHPFLRHGARNHRSLLRHGVRSNPLTPFRTSAPIVAGTVPPAPTAGACLRYRRCPQSWLRTTTATFRRWCRSSSKRKASVWSR